MSHISKQGRWHLPHARWRVCAALAFVPLVFGVAACGGDELSLTEYVDRINVAADQAGQRAEQLTEEGVLTGELTPVQIKAGMLRGLEEIRRPLQEAVEEIEPPDQVADLHTLLWSWHEDFIGIEATLAERFGTTPDTEAGWTELSSSPEMAAYRDSLEAGKQVCIDFQAQLDATERRGAFEDVPWLPAEMSEVVIAALGCEWFPDDPQSIYRYPP